MPKFTRVAGEGDPDPLTSEKELDGWGKATDNNTG